MDKVCKQPFFSDNWATEILGATTTSERHHPLIKYQKPTVQQEH